MRDRPTVDQRQRHPLFSHNALSRRHQSRDGWGHLEGVTWEGEGVTSLHAWHPALLRVGRPAWPSGLPRGQAAQRALGFDSERPLQPERNLSTERPQRVVVSKWSMHAYVFSQIFTSFHKKYILK